MPKSMNANVGDTRAFTGTVEALPDIVPFFQEMGSERMPLMPSSA